MKVREVHGQYSIKNLQGRSVRLDILAVDEQNRAYNIEVQRSDRGASEKRARYNSSLLDANLTHSGSNYDALNETYIIFITENDVLKAGLPIYHIHRMVEETGAVFNDQSHIIYVNSQIKDETALGKLMHDFFCTDAKDMFYPVLANRVQYFKHDAKEWQLCAEQWKKCVRMNESSVLWRCSQMECLMKRWQSILNCLLKKSKNLPARNLPDKIKYCYVPSNGRNAWR